MMEEYLRSRMVDIRKMLNIWEEKGINRIIRHLIRKSISIEMYAKLRRYELRMKGWTAIGDPLRVYNIRCSRLEHITGHKDRSLFSIKGGTWHEQRTPFEQTYRYRLFKKHFERGIPWEETEEFQEKAEKLEQYGEIGALDLPPEEQSIKKLKQYYNYIDDLYYKIKDQGYKRQEELTKRDDFANRDMHPSLNEIQVCVGPNGDMIVESGYHRYTIAKLLNIEKVPVRTKIRHSGWQRTREKIIQNNEANCFRYQDHPEVQDILN